MTASVRPAPVPARDVRTRRVAIDYRAGDLPRHFTAGDLVTSHLFAALSAVFPEGEDFFVRSVRSFRGEIEDPELMRQVAGFVGQEAMHGREHRQFNARLQALGFPTRVVDRGTKVGLALLGRVLSKRQQLAVTAALEHYTATFAEVVLRDERAQALLSEPEVRAIFLWHALEETEHKSVAFDVYQSVAGDHVVRVAAMQGVTVGFLGSLVLTTSLSLLLDPASRDLGRLARSLARLRDNPFLTAGFAARIRDYNRRDFHPDDHDCADLLDRWRAELFGDGGEMAGMVRGDAAVSRRP